uniref:Carboxylesterase type B domain-containing protein n=1 Tax=Daphnia galeata TaxID=27404 RepID=A0A8J2RFA7_9CRUS|nr:unnamed protein product [Daphnia galeata]
MDAGSSSIQLMSQHSDQPVYYYHYAHRGQHSITKMLDLPKNADFGVCHADELMLMFTSNLIPPMTDHSDIRASKMLLDLWTSFAANGVPQSDEIIGHWLPTTQQQPRYLQIDLESPVLVNDVMPFHSRLDFWTTLLGSYSKVSVKEELCMNYYEDFDTSFSPSPKLDRSDSAHH